MATTYGPKQLPALLGLDGWQWRRGRNEGLIPPADIPAGRGAARWSEAAYQELAGRLEQLVADLGTVPDCGSWKAAKYLTDKFDLVFDGDHIIHELVRVGALRTAGDYEGYTLYSGRDLEAITDRALVETAARNGKTFITADARDILGLRERDFVQVVARGWLRPARWVASRRGADIALYRAADLVALRDHPGIDWDAIRAVPAGQRSIIPTLPDPTTPQES